MPFEILILGSGAATPTFNRNCSAQYLTICGTQVLIDCGESTQNQIRKYHKKFQTIKAIFISHLHGDHVYGLFPLISTLGLYGRRTPLRVYAPAPFGEMLEAHLRLFDQELPYEVEWVEVDTTKHRLVSENRTVEIWTIPLRHRVPCCGYLFREKEPGLNVEKFKIAKYNLSIAQITAAKRGEDVTLEDGTVLRNEELTYRPYRARSYAYLSDTNFSAKVANLCRGVDLMYHEATYAAAEQRTARQRGHATTIDAAKAALKAEARGLIIGHYSARYKTLEPLLEEARTLFQNTALAIEGEEFTIEKQP